MIKFFLTLMLAAVVSPLFAQESGFVRGPYYEAKLTAGNDLRMHVNTVPNGGLPFRYAQHENFPEVLCITSGATVKTQGTSKPVGEMIEIRRPDSNGVADVIVEDSYLVDKIQTPGDRCTALTVKTGGLPRTSLEIKLPQTGESVRVPIKGTEYFLEITRHPD